MRIIKIGGRAQQHPALAHALATAWNSKPGALCVVHGGGDEVSALQRSLGIEPAFSGGRRVTTERDVQLVRMALSGTANKRLVSQLVSLGVHAVGISGEDAALIAARRTAEAQMGCVGTPERINVALLWQLLDGGFLPVVSPVSRDWASGAGAARNVSGDDAAAGAALNVNGDDAAAAIAVAAGAEELFFMADVDGVMVDGRATHSLDADEALDLIARGTAGGGMAAKLQAAVTALEGGVEQVRIGSLAALNDRRLGTLLVPVRSVA